MNNYSRSNAYYVKKYQPKRLTNIATMQKANNQNKKFDITKLKLVPTSHRSRLILAFRDMYTNNIFYDNLNKRNREEINKLLFELWDKYKPYRIDTNCGERSRDEFHCKLIFEHQTFVQLLRMHCDNDTATINAYIKHYNQHKQNIIRKHEIIEAQYFQNDLRIYINKFQVHKNNWYPKIYSWTTSKLKLHLNEQICENVLFDINDTKQTVLYLEYNTNQKRADFKMVDYEKEINEMIIHVLRAVKCLINRTKKGNCKRNNFPTGLFEWFKLNFRSYQKQVRQQTSESKVIDDEKVEKQSEMKNTMVIRVEAYVTVLNYLYFVCIYKKEWLKRKTNKKLMNNWYKLYRDHIFSNQKDALQCSKHKFNCPLKRANHKELNIKLS